MNINQRLYYETQFNLLGHTLCKMFEELDKENPRRKNLGKMMECLTLLIDDMYKTKRIQYLENTYDKDIQKLNNKINELNNTIRFNNLEESRFAERNGK